MSESARRPIGMDEETWRRVVAQAPSRFVFCLEREDETLGEVVGWGMAFEDDAVVAPVGDGLAGRYSSAEKALWIHGAARPVQLAWIDEPVSDQPVPEEPVSSEPDPEEP